MTDRDAKKDKQTGKNIYNALAVARFFMPQSYVFRSTHAFRRGMAKRAFTLVEVVLALAVVVFGLIAFIGLISVSLKNAQQANAREALTMTMDRMTSLYQGQGFTNAIALSQQTTNYYFDSGGLPTTTPASYFFQCSVTNVTPAADAYSFKNATASTPGFAPTNYLGVLQLETRWPYPALTLTNVSLISIFNCQ